MPDGAVKVKAGGLMRGGEDLNPRPPHYEGGALPPELPPRGGWRRSHGRIPHPAPYAESPRFFDFNQATIRLLHATAAAFSLALCCAAPAYAQGDEWVAFPRQQAADLLAKSAELDAVKKQVTALEATVAAQDAQIKAQAALIKTQDEMLERQTRITGLADEERDVYKGRAERIAKDAARGNLWLRVQARAGAGALIGAAAAPLFPPAALLGPAAGALVGLIEHWLAD